MKKFIKTISLLLIICFVNTIVPWPSFAGEVEEVLGKLTPQQKEKLKNLTPEEKSKIQTQLGLVAPAESAKGFSFVVTNEADKKIGPIEAKELTNRDSLKEQLTTETEINAELSQIEKNFNLEGSGKVIKQFGYEIFSKAVGQQFALTSGVALGPDYRINAGDKLLVTIWGNVNDSFALEVDERGVITLPKVGVVEVAGNTLAEAKEIIYQRLMNVFIVDFNIDLTIKEIGTIKVYMMGEFSNPGAYTLTATNTLYDAIFIGGGAKKGGSLRQIELVRNGMIIRRVDLYDFILTGNKRDDMPLKTGDVVRIPPIGKVVAIKGNVRQPAIYELKGKTELSDLLILTGGITPTSYLKRVQIERKKQNRFETAIDVNYADYQNVKKSKPIYIENLDIISVFSIESTIRNVVYLIGNVNRPGRYELEPNMRLMDLIVKAEGLAPDTFLERAQLYRLSPDERRPEIVAINLNKMKAGDPQHNPTLQEFDQVRIFSKIELQGEPKVFISGELNDGEGLFPLSKNMRVSDLIYQAGGIKESTYLEKAELIRTGADLKMSIYTLDLKKILFAKDKQEDILLQKNDYLFVRRIPDYGINATVIIQGNVKFPGKYVVYPEERLSSLIERAGSYTEKAFLSGAVFIRQSLKVKQEEDKKEIKAELERERRYELFRVPFGLATAEGEYMESRINTKYDQMLKNMQGGIAGRIIVDLDKMSPGNAYDITLQAGDYIYLPDQEVGVTVLGEVYSPGTILYEAGKSIDDYLRVCGGLNNFADQGAIRILRANGKMEQKSWNFAVKPGDTIMVPAKPIELNMYQKPFNWNEFWDTSMKAATVVAQTATALVTVYLLYKSIK